MKRSVKISLVLVILGAILAGLGWWNHGDKTIVWNNQSRRLRVANTAHKVYYPGKYRDIQVTSALPVTIKRGATSQVTVRSGSGMAQQPKVTVKRGQLTVTAGSRSSHDNVIFGADLSSSAANGITITVPASQKLRNVRVTKSQEGVNLRYLKLRQLTVATADDVSLQQVSTTEPTNVTSQDGDVWLASLTTPQLKVQTADGDITLTSVDLTSKHNQVTAQEGGDVRLTESKLGGGRVTTHDGDIHLQNNRLQDHLTATTTDGDVQAHIAQSAGAVVNSADGDIHVLGKSQKSGYRLNRGAKAWYQLSSHDGDIHLSTDK